MGTLRDELDNTPDTYLDTGRPTTQLIARSLDNARLTYDGRAYIEIPKQMSPQDAVVVHKKRLPHLRGVGDSSLIEARRRLRELVDAVKAHRVALARYAAEPEMRSRIDKIHKATERLHALAAEIDKELTT